MSEKSVKIGFIGQGWIGRNYADDFERRGFDVVRYALEEPYAGNKGKLADREIVFVAVPTPTTPSGFNPSILKAALSNVSSGAIAVIKSTVLPGTTEELQNTYPDIVVVHSPEFLTEATAAYDAANPSRNIVGIPKETDAHRNAAALVLSVLPKAPFELVCSSREAEIIKYAGNTWFYVKVVYTNMLYDLAEKLGCKWETVRDAMAADPRIGRTHLDPIHKSGRGAGGHCFIKDFKAFEEKYEKVLPEDTLGLELLRSLEAKNMELLVESGKDLDLVKGVYGEQATRTHSEDR